jgi:hypothetical protein
LTRLSKRQSINHNDCFWPKAATQNFPDSELPMSALGKSRHSGAST